MAKEMILTGAEPNRNFCFLGGGLNKQTNIEKWEQNSKENLHPTILGVPRPESISHVGHRIDSVVCTRSTVCIFVIEFNYPFLLQYTIVKGGGAIGSLYVGIMLNSK